MRDVIFAVLMAGVLAAAPAWSQDNGDNNDSGNNDGNSGGQPVDGDVRDQMEEAFGNDVSGVRNHSGNEGATMSENSGAQAYTHGGNIYLDSAETAGGERGGRVMAHELAHAVQQRGMQSTATDPDDAAPDDEADGKDEPEAAVETRSSEQRRDRRRARRVPD